MNNPPILINEDFKNYSDYNSANKIKELFILIISELSENLILKHQLFSCQGFYPDILFLKLDYFSKKNICTQDILHYLEQHNYKFNDEIVRKFIKRYDKHENYNLIYDDFLKIISPNDKNINYNKQINNIDEIFCNILINELKLIGIIGENALQIIHSNNEFDSYNIFKEMSKNGNYITKEILYNFLENKFNENEINLLLYYIDSNNDGLISYEDFHDLLMPIKSDFNYDERNLNECHINYNLDFNNLNNNINLNEKNNFNYQNNCNDYNKKFLSNQNDYMLYNDLNLPKNCDNIYNENNINENNLDNIENKQNQEKFDSGNNNLNYPIINNEEFIQLYNKYYNNSNDINENQNQNEICEEIKNNTTKDFFPKILKEEEISIPDYKENTYSSGQKFLNNIPNELIKKNNNNDSVYNEENKNIYPNYNQNQNIIPNNKEEDLNENLNINQYQNLNEEENNDKVNQIPENTNNINNPITLQQFPLTFGYNQKNNFQNPNINDENNNIINNNINGNTQIMPNMEKDKIYYKEEMNHYIKKYLYNNININDNEIHNYQTFNNKINLNKEIYNDSKYNDFPSKTYSFPIKEKEKENININSNKENVKIEKKTKKHSNKNKNNDLIEDINIFLEFINLIILNENRIEHIKESLALREDLSLNEIFYLFDKEQKNFISTNDFYFICRKIFNLFPTLDQINLLFKRYTKGLINKQQNITLNLNEFFEMMTPIKNEFKNMINKKKLNDKLRIKLSKKSKNILRELIKSLILKETNYYKIKSKLKEKSIEKIWKEISKYSKNEEKINQKEMNKFLEKYGYFLGNSQLEKIFFIFDKEKKGNINYDNFFEEMFY